MKPNRGAVSTDRQQSSPRRRSNFTRVAISNPARRGRDQERNVTGSSDSVLSSAQPSWWQRGAGPHQVHARRTPRVWTLRSPGEPGRSRPSRPTRVPTQSCGGWGMDRGVGTSPGVLAGFRTRAPRVLPTSPQPRRAHRASSQKRHDVAHLRPRRSLRRTRPAARYSRYPRSGRGCTGSAGPRSAP